MTLSFAAWHEHILLGQLNAKRSMSHVHEQGYQDCVDRAGLLQAQAQMTNRFHL